MFLTGNNHIKWKLLGVAAIVVATLCVAGVLWFDLPIYVFLYQFDWLIWRLFDAVFATKIWLGVSGLGTVWLVFLAARDNVFNAMKNAGKSSELSNKNTPSFAKRFNIWRKIGRLTVKARECFYNFTQWLNGGKKAKILVASFSVFLSVALASVVTSILKISIGRMRPVFYEAFGQTGFYPGVKEWAFNSMPSGHTSASFAGLVMIGLLFPRIKWATWTLAIIIGISRVCAGAHFPADVILGAFIGMFATDLVKSVMDKKCW